MRFCLMVTGPAYGTQQSSSAWLFSRELLVQKHKLESVFFYREGVLNANLLNSSDEDEINLTQYWQWLHYEHGVKLNICISAALRRGITDNKEDDSSVGIDEMTKVNNLAAGFQLSGLGTLTEMMIKCERIVQF